MTSVVRKHFPLLLVMAAGSMAIFAASLVLYLLGPKWRGHHEPLHSAIEALGGLAAIAMAMVLFIREGGTGRRIPAALGFLSMGVLEEFHAASYPGNGFILLRGLASFAGGIGFSLVWLSDLRLVQWERKGLPWFVAGGAFILGVGVLMFPNRVPEMMRNGEFAPSAVALTSLASLCFLSAALRFFLRYRSLQKSEDYLFACLALLFGLAEVMFTYSVLWDAQWWFWHFLRLTAYLLVLGYLVHDYRRMITDLTSSLAVTQRAEETSRRSEQHLRQVLKEREQMAQDLHDGAIQSLFALRLALERCQRLVTKDPLETVGQLTKSIAALTTVIRDLRAHIVGGEPRLASGRELDQALVSLIKNVEGSQDLRVNLRVDPSTLERVTPDQATHLIYVAREALSNSLRHAQARSALVSLQRQVGGMRLMVEDDGRGFSPLMAEGQGVGLKNMAARAERLGGQLSIVSEPGRGTRIILDLPQEPVHAEK